MSFRDPFTNPPDPGMNSQPYMGQSPPYDPTSSFSSPPIPGVRSMRQRPYRRRGPRLGCLITLVVLIALLFASYATFAHTWTIFGPTTIPVKAHPTLVINSQRYEQIDLPTISIHAGTDNSKILLQVVSPGNVSLPWNFGIDGFQQSSDGSVIILNGDPVGGRELDITVPAGIDLKVNTNAANIDVTGITGQMTFITNSGAITLTRCHVTGTSLFNNNTGAITMTQSTLDGQVTLSNNQGPITFTGSIGSTGTYAMTNNQGSIDATVPQNSSFQLDAKTNSGSITSDYPGIQIAAGNKQTHVNVGSSPNALLSLNTNAGTIALHMQKGT
jgi:Putative adhesin